MSAIILSANKGRSRINELKAKYKLGELNFAFGRYFENGKEILKKDPRYSAVKRCVDLFPYAYPKVLIV